MGKKIKIIHVLNSNKFSGAERVAIQMIHFLSKHGMESWYVSPKGEIEKRLRIENVKYYPIDKINPKNIRKMLKHLQPSVIHAHDYRVSIICAFSTNIPIISHLHNNSPWIKKYGVYSWMYMFSSICYKKILLVSDSILKEYVFAKFIRKKCEVIGNPVNIGEIIKRGRMPMEAVSTAKYTVEKVYLEKVELKNERISDQKEKYDIIFVGRLSPKKTHFFYWKLFGN